jgi:hypothetical protein
MGNTDGTGYGFIGGFAGGYAVLKGPSGFSSGQAGDSANRLEEQMQRQEHRMMEQIQELLANRGGLGMGSGAAGETWFYEGSTSGDAIVKAKTVRFAGETSFQEGSASGDAIIKAKTVRLDFPRFDGEDPESWSCRAEQFFDFYNTPAEHRIALSSFHMDGKALVWYRELRTSN